MGWPQHPLFLLKFSFFMLWSPACLCWSWDEARQDSLQDLPLGPGPGRGSVWSSCCQADLGQGQILWGAEPPSHCSHPLSPEHSPQHTPHAAGRLTLGCTALGTVPQGWQQLCLDAAARHLSGAVRSPWPPGCWVTGQKKPLEGPWLFLQISCHPPSSSSNPTVGGVG